MAKSTSYPIGAIRRAFCKELPLLAGFVRACTFVPVEDHIEKTSGAAWSCDKYWRIYFDPKVLETGPGKVSKMTHVCSILHELVHLRDGHHSRGKKLLNKKAMYTAFEYAVNSDSFIQNHDQDFAAGKLVEARQSKLPYNKASEWYYRKLVEAEKEKEKERGKERGDKPGNKPGDERTEPGKGKGEGKEPGKEPGKGEGKGEGKGKGEGEGEGKEPGKGGCGGGSGTGGPSKPWEQGAPGEGKAPGLTEAQGERVRKSEGRKIAEAIQNGSRNAGKGLSQGWANWATTSIAPPKKDWKQELGAVVFGCAKITSGGTKRSYRRRSRRQGASGCTVRLAGSYNPVLEVAYVEDNSSSVSDKDLCELRAEIPGIVQAARGGVTYIACSRSVSKVVKDLKHARSLTGRDRGGTDMRVGIKFASELKPTPQIIILGTDGYTEHPKREDMPHGVELIYALVGRHCRRESIPAWIRVVTLD